MSFSSSSEMDAYATRRREALQDAGTEGHSCPLDTQPQGFGAAHFLRQSGGHSASAPLRAAAIQSAQQIYGNRAVQRSLGRVSVQRFGWDDALGIVGGPLARYALDPDKEKAQERSMSGMVQQGQKRYNSFIESAEDTAGGLLHGAADMVKDVPVIGGMAGSAANIAEQFIQFEGGAAKGAVGTMAGLANMALNPVDTAKGLGEIGRHLPYTPGVGLPTKTSGAGIGVLTGDKKPGEAFDEAFGEKGVNEDLAFWKQLGGRFLEPYGESASKGKYAEVGGRAAWDIASLVLGLGELSEGSQGSKGARTAGEVPSTVPEGPPTIPDGPPTIPDGPPTIPDGPPTIPDGPPTIPDGPPTIPDGPPTIPDGPPSMPEPPSSLPNTRPSTPMRRPIGFDRPLEPYPELRVPDPYAPRRPAGFDGPTEAEPPTLPNPPGWEPGTPMRRPVGFDRGLEPIAPQRPRKPIGFDRWPDIEPPPSTPRNPPGWEPGTPMRRPIGFDRPLEPVVPKRPPGPIGFDRWPDLPDPSSVPGSSYLDMFGL